MIPQSNPPAPRWQRRPEARPEEILDAAQEIFGEYGFARAKLDDVAQRAGVSKGTVYLYFDSKEALFREMVRAKIVPMIEQGEALVEQHEGPYRDLLVTLVRTMFDRMQRGGLGRIARLVTSELTSFPELGRFYFDEVILRARRLLELVLDRGIASGEFRPVAHRFAARGLPLLLVQTSLSQCFYREFDPQALSDEAALEGIIELCLEGVLTRSPMGD
ncbi:MAG TPA: TetR/AcrR family transcriptional regulator [Gemmatimonadales bacterium]|nr:TetR/AcrR family transcriptional regulator [Gemmatimonadales bacterium]